ncbi:protein YciI [Gammaproteobacteria bacterium]
MLYAIISEDAPGTLEVRRNTRSTHLARLQALRDQGRLILAGPHPAIDAEDPGNAGFTGSLIVAEFSSLDAAQEWSAADPYVEAGVHVRVTIKPFRKILP